MITSSRPVWAKVSKTLSQNQNTSKRTGGVDQVVEHLHIIFETLNSIPRAAKDIKTK
jgi:hypothetical protein